MCLVYTISERLSILFLKIFQKIFGAAGQDNTRYIMGKKKEGLRPLVSVGRTADFLHFILVQIDDGVLYLVAREALG